MVSRLALLPMLLMVTPLCAEDQPKPSPAASARAEVSVTILRGEEIRPLPRVTRTQSDTIPPPPPDRQYATIAKDQIRIDFY